MKQGWDAVFRRKTEDKRVPIETHPYLCGICNSDMARFANPVSYATHMTTHKFHWGYDRRLPPPSAKKGRVLPKISKKKKEEKEDLCQCRKSVGLRERKELQEKQEEES